MLKQLLQQLDFTDKEVAVYVAVQKQGSVSPAQLSQLTGINRTTVYSTAKQLIKRGLIREDLGTSPSTLLALPPQELEGLIKEEEKKLAEKNAAVQLAVGQLAELAKSAKYSIPRIVFVEEERLGGYLYKQTPEWDRSISQVDGIWWGFQDATFTESYQGWVDWYWRKPESLSLRMLTSESAIEEQMKERQYSERQMKFWKGGEAFSATTWVNGDYLVMITTSQRPHYLVEIHDRTLAQNMRELFKGIWAAI